MTVEEIRKVKNVLIASKVAIQPKYIIEKEKFDDGRMKNFHHMADGELYEGAFLIRNEYGQAYWLVLIQWNSKIGYYVIVYPEKRTGPMIEIHKLVHEENSKSFKWRYKPSKRDPNNENRKHIFEKYYLDVNVVISFPEKPFEVLGFLDELFSLAEIRLKADGLTTEEPEVRESFPEGKRIERLHYSRERNPKVVRLAKAKFKANHGRVFCEACGFDFQKKYGEIGEDYMEAHHTLPLSDIKEEQIETRIEDIVLLCCNCHKMVHRRRPWLSVEKIKSLLIAQV